MICDYGCGSDAVNILKNGKRCCSVSYNSCPAIKAKNSERVKAKRAHLGDSYWKNGHPKGNTNGKALKDKTYEDIYGTAADQHRASRSLSNKGKGSYDKLTAKQKIEHADRARKNIIARYEAGWMPKAGRCKKIQYVSPIAGIIWVDGTWELAVAKWLYSKEYNWKRNTKRFSYTNLKGNISNYTPDFFVEELEGFIEVKGYETALDLCKWEQFPEKLIVWKRKELTENGIFDILKNKEGGQAGNAADC